MIFAAGKTKCESCRIPLDSTDDYIAVNVAQLNKSLPAPGFYHPQCFDALPTKPDYLNYFQQETSAYLKDHAQIWTVLEIGPQYSAAFVPFTDEVFLYFLTKGRTINLSCKGPWAELCDFLFIDLKGLLPATENVAFSDNFFFSIASIPSRGEVVLGIRNNVTKMIRISRDDAVRINKTKPGWDKPGVFADLDELCTASKIKPLLIEGLLNNFKGVILEASITKDHLTVRIASERWEKIALSVEEYNLFLAFIKRIE